MSSDDDCRCGGGFIQVFGNVSSSCTGCSEGSKDSGRDCNLTTLGLEFCFLPTPFDRSADLSGTAIGFSAGTDEAGIDPSPGVPGDGAGNDSLLAANEAMMADESRRDASPKAVVDADGANTSGGRKSGAEESVESRGDERGSSPRADGFGGAGGGGGVGTEGRVGLEASVGGRGRREGSEERGGEICRTRERVESEGRDGEAERGVPGTRRRATRGDAELGVRGEAVSADAERGRDGEAARVGVAGAEEGVGVVVPDGRSEVTGSDLGAGFLRWPRRRRLRFFLV